MMTREENICQSCAHSKVCKFNDGESSEYCNQHLALTALRPVSREQVEKVWRGEWEMVSNSKGICSKCHRQDGIDPLAKFCRYCGALMTDEAVDIIMERLGEIYEAG